MPIPPLNPAPYQIGEEITYYSFVHDGERRGFIREIRNRENNNPNRWYYIVDTRDQLADPAAPDHVIGYALVERTNDGLRYAAGYPAGQQQGGRTRRVRRVSRKHTSRRAAKHRRRR